MTPKLKGDSARMTDKALRYALERAIELMPPYDSPDWKTQPDNCKCDVNLARMWMSNVLKELEPTMPTKTETDIDAKHEEWLVRMAEQKLECIDTPISLLMAIEETSKHNHLRLIGILGNLTKYGIEYAEPGFDHRMKSETVQDLVELGELVKGIVEDYLEAEE